MTDTHILRGLYGSRSLSRQKKSTLQSLDKLIEHAVCERRLSEMSPISSEFAHWLARVRITVKIQI